MTFHSFPFLFVFLPTVLLVYELLRRKGPTGSACAWLTISSLVFYGWWGPAFLAVILGSAVFNYFAVCRMTAEEGSSRQRFFVFILVVDIVVLAFFKYFTHTLPLGLSFYTFSQLAFVIASYSDAAPRPEFKDYFLFVIFFPYVSSGPIADASNVTPQFQKLEALDGDTRLRDIAVGITLVTLGLFKKTVLADGIAIYARPVFEAAALGNPVSPVDAWLGAVSFMFQLYFDFSGYSDMAIGVARLFGVQVPWNFDSPYQSSNLVEFWRRWHMSLSHFLTNYIYTPLALAITRYRMANQKVSVKSSGVAAFLSAVALPSLLTMAVAGLWHGTGWSYLIFGALHGIYLVANHAWLKFKKGLPFLATVPAFVRVGSARIITLLAVMVSFVFFNAADVPSALRLLESMSGLGALPMTNLIPIKRTSVWVLGLLAIVWFAPNSMRWTLSEKWRASIPAAIVFGAMAAAALWCIVTVNRPTEFVYFQF